MASKGPLGGSDQKDPQGPPFRDPGFRISGFTIWSGDYVDALQLHYVDTNTGSTFDGPKYGGDGGNSATIDFGGDENLTGITIHSGRWIDSLTFFTSTEGQYTFGGSGGPNVENLSGEDSTIQTIYDLAVGFGRYLNNLTIYYPDLP